MEPSGETVKSSVVLGEVVSLSLWTACPTLPLLWGPCTAATLGDHGLCWWQQEAVTDNCHHTVCAVGTLCPQPFLPEPWVWGPNPTEAGFHSCLGEGLTPAQGEESIDFFLPWSPRPGFLGVGNNFSVKRVHIFWRKMSQHFKDDRSH